MTQVQVVEKPPQEEEPTQKTEPKMKPKETKKMNALMHMREHIGRHMRGELSEDSFELDSVVTEREREAMHSSPFGRINDIMGDLAGTTTEAVADKTSVVQPAPAFKFTARQFSIMETVHNRFLFYLFQSNAPDLAEVYLQACSEEEYEEFMSDFPVA